MGKRNVARATNSGKTQSSISLSVISRDAPGAPARWAGNVPVAGVRARVTGAETPRRGLDGVPEPARRRMKPSRGDRPRHTAPGTLPRRGPDAQSTDGAASGQMRRGSGPSPGRPPDRAGRSRIAPGVCARRWVIRCSARRAARSGAESRCRGSREARRLVVAAGGHPEKGSQAVVVPVRFAGLLSPRACTRSGVSSSWFPRGLPARGRGGRQAAG